MARDVLAEFHSNKSQHMGGILTINKISESKFKDPELKALMTFLAIYLRRRGKSNFTLYRHSKRKGNRWNIF